MRTDGYAPIEDYAAIGDGRTVGLVAKDGSLDWLCLPDLDSAPVFARLLDADRGGAFAVQPEERFESERRYLPDTNVLETTFRTAAGSIRLTDALTLVRGAGLAPMREVVRRVDGVDGRVPLRWSFEPRFAAEQHVPSIRRVAGRLVAACGKDSLALSVFGAPEPELGPGRASGTFEVEAGATATFAVTAAHREPVVLPSREDVERRLAATEEFWRSWSGRIARGGRFRDEVVRSALALKLLVFAPSGAIVAAPTTSLPEWVGGERNWDYRYAWVRDAALTLSAFLRLGLGDEPRAFLWWLAHATALTHPRLDVLYTLGGTGPADEEQVGALEGYRASRPVRFGNGAKDQLQLDVYGYALHAFWRHATESGDLAGAHGRTIAKIADWVAEHWQEDDSGIWEVRSRPTAFIQSKAMCAVALDRACDLAGQGLVPDHRPRWTAAAAAIREFVDEHGWDPERRTFVRAPDLCEADGSLLTLALLGFEDPASDRVAGLVDALRAELMEGPLLDRYRGDDGVGGPQGTFITCSFWLASVLARAGRAAEAGELLERLLPYANDVGLYSEEIGPDGAKLGNFPQALVHLALIDAALDIEEAETR